MIPFISPVIGRAATSKEIVFVEAERSRGFGITTIDVGLPPSRANGDLVILTILASSSAGSFTTPTGWTLITTGAGGRYVSYYKVMTGSESSPLTITSSSSVGKMATATLVRGAIAADGGTVSMTATTTPTTSSVTIPSLPAKLLWLCDYDNFGATLTAPSGYTEEYRDVNGPTGLGIVIASKTEASAGSTGAVAGAMSSSGVAPALMVVLT